VDQEKCIKQHVQTVIRKLKYLLYPQATDLYIAGNATRNINRRDIKNIFDNFLYYKYFIKIIERELSLLYTFLVQ